MASNTREQFNITALYLNEARTWEQGLIFDLESEGD